MPNQIKTVLSIYTIFALMGLWLGNHGYAIWELNHRLNDYAGSGTGDAESDFIEMLALFLSLFGFFGFMMDTVVHTEVKKNNNVDDVSMGRPQTLICSGIAITGGCMFYGYMAGPVTQTGNAMSPWLIFPMAGWLTASPLICKLFELDTSGTIGQTEDNA